MLWLGLGIYAGCLAVALLAPTLLHYWTALVLLGIGWNFLFLCGTNLLPLTYRPEERFRVQSLNDFLVFTVQAGVSLSSGWFLFHWGWSGLVWACFPALALFAVLLWRTARRLPARPA